MVQHITAAEMHFFVSQFSAIVHKNIIHNKVLTLLAGYINEVS